MKYIKIFLIDFIFWKHLVLKKYAFLIYWRYCYDNKCMLDLFLFNLYLITNSDLIRLCLSRWKWDNGQVKRELKKMKFWNLSCAQLEQFQKCFKQCWRFLFIKKYIFMWDKISFTIAHFLKSTETVRFEL